MLSFFLLPIFCLYTNTFHALPTCAFLYAVYVILVWSAMLATLTCLYACLPACALHFCPLPAGTVLGPSCDICDL
jgi:hypothetical protein